MRLRVPFGRREAIGVLLETTRESELPPNRLKPVLEVLDKQPVLTEPIFKLLLWAADYYQHPLGDVLQTALPVKLRRGRPAEPVLSTQWTLTEAGSALTVADIKRAPAQARLLAALAGRVTGMTVSELAQISSGYARTIKQMQLKGWVQSTCRPLTPASRVCQPVAGPELNAEQHHAAKGIIAGLGSFSRFLLYGVTGSGKTEVYLRAIAETLARQQQALVLVPEISLTPQLVERFQARLGVPLAILHSGLNDSQRLQAWLDARSGQAKLVLGTRSAVLTPMPQLGLIIVDEEHDQSYKQQDGFRYHARDLAVMRARDAAVPVVLGSATPSLESVYNVERGHYQLLSLPERIGNASMPHIQTLDMRRLSVSDGLSPMLVDKLRDRLHKREQSLLFLNRRGFSPVYMCYQCGWIAPCKRCDARLTFHKSGERLRCHHCGSEAPLPQTCPQCGDRRLKPLGEGTERIETTLNRYFPDARIARFDRDSTQQKGALENMLSKMRHGEIDILVGTQMLSKGHDFPNVTLVGVINADQGLYSLDFRAPEYMFQQVMQVSGRAGRAEKAGEVLIQTYHPQHPLFEALAKHDYMAFAASALAERKTTRFPPFSFLVLLRVETPNKTDATVFAQQAYELAAACDTAPGLQVADPVPAPMERRAGRYRMQLLVQAAQRSHMQRFLNQWLPLLEQSQAGKRVRWHLDRDPVDLY